MEVIFKGAVGMLNILFVHYLERPLSKSIFLIVVSESKLLISFILFYFVLCNVLLFLIHTICSLFRKAIEQVHIFNCCK